MAAGTVVIRIATPSDAAAVRMLGLQVFLDTYGPDGVSEPLAREAGATFAWAHVHRWFTDPDHLVLVAEGAGSLGGFAQLALGVDPTFDLSALGVERFAGGIVRAEHNVV